ncbi:vWA domain-containing protein [Prauserella cavernicola]|uniref:VWA domain-containing protein n=1 Tax=Prauserella cavernicola TaxID=2800127 RepID=A0A934QXL8_9PSEU|nr:VWA domain-containing protein [Prauserella cavernicola]MBK1787154.1 VWA domain-containing protein [Prauserella cavernicola]
MGNSRTRLRALAVAVGVATGLSLFADAATAQQERERPAPVMVTVDASGSMADEVEAGLTKMDAAKEALNTLVDGIGADAELGLQVYGSQGATVDGGPGCDDILTEVPVGPMDAAEVKSKVAALTPTGETPIGESLRQAAAELPETGPRAIVLISDGLDTCAPPDPCEVAAELAEDGVDLTVHTVGFQIDEQAKEQLSCIAETTGGSYTDAPDAKTLDEQLPQVVERAQRSYEAEGTPITGTEDYPQAPEIQPGQYVDTIDSGQTKYYGIRIPKGFTVHFAATAILPKDEDGGWADINTQIVDPQGKECSGEQQSVYVSSADYSTAHGTAAFSWDTATESDCGADEQYYLSVERDGPDQANHWTWQTELLVVLEPPVSSAAGSEENTAEVPFTNPGGAEQPVTGGGSFNDAIELSDSGVYTDTLLVNEMATYKVRLDWGEALAVQTHASNDLDDWVGVEYRIYDPVRNQGSNYWEAGFDLYEQADTGDPVATSRVLYGNREAGEQASLPGWYYITVQTSGDVEAPVEIPIRMYVSKGGKPAQGPEYVKTEGYPQAPVDNAGALSGDPEREQRLVGQASTENAGMPGWFWVALAGGGALVVAGVTTVLVRTRGRAPSTRQPTRHW